MTILTCPDCGSIKVKNNKKTAKCERCNHQAQIDKFKAAPSDSGYDIRKSGAALTTRTILLSDENE